MVNSIWFKSNENTQLPDPSTLVLFCPSFVIDDVDAEASELLRTDPGALTLLSVVGVCSCWEKKMKIVNEK